MKRPIPRMTMMPAINSTTMRARDAEVRGFIASNSARVFGFVAGKRGN